MEDYETAEQPTQAAEQPGSYEQEDSPDLKLVTAITERIRADKRHHQKHFKVMQEDMAIARRGADESWSKNNYTANITGRHINNTVAALYAKNPKAVARRRQRLDFQLWDERPESLMQAMQMVEMAAAAPDDPQAFMAAQQAQILIDDVLQGLTTREQTDKLGRVLEILFEYYTKEQKPVDFKVGMKQLVRRAATTGVGYVTVKFQRDMERDMDVANQLADARTQLAFIRSRVEELQSGDPNGEMETDSAKMRELEYSIQSLTSREFVLIREGLVFDFPEATRVIPDKMCRSIRGFIGCRWLTIEHLYTPDEVKEVFGVDLKKGYKPYSMNGAAAHEETAAQMELDSGDESSAETRGDLVAVWEHYDKRTGLVYYIADGCKQFLRSPAAPDVYVEDFWPIYALTFNEVEDPSCCFPPSDVRLMLPMQKDYNEARQGAREHRFAARPKWATSHGALTDETKAMLASAQPFEVIEVQTLAPGQSIADLLQPIPIPGVDPNLYQTGELMTDVQLVVGAQEAAFGATANATATESSIAESSRAASISSKVDDLDSFLTEVARASGQIMLKELSQETVMKIAGAGAVWPQLTLEDLAGEVYLEIEAGSSGKPNQAQEIHNWKEMLPFLIQMPSITPVWLARETLRRLDDKMDLTDALTEGLPSIVTQNRMATAGPSDPNAAPEAQGGEGVQNEAPTPGGAAGTGPAMGNNQV